MIHDDRSDLTCHFFDFVGKCSSPKMGTAMVCLFIMFQFILVSWVCLNKKWIAGYPVSGKEITGQIMKHILDGIWNGFPHVTVI